MKTHCCNGDSRAKEPEKLASFLRIVADSNRVKIISLLRKGEKCVCEIWKDLNLSQNLVSHHLKELKKLDLIVSRKKGLNVIYSFNKSKMKEYLDQMNNLLLN